MKRLILISILFLAASTNVFSQVTYHVGSTRTYKTIDDVFRNHINGKVLKQDVIIEIDDETINAGNPDIARLQTYWGSYNITIRPIAGATNPVIEGVFRLFDAMNFTIDGMDKLTIRHTNTGTAPDYLYAINVRRDTRNPDNVTIKNLRVESVQGGISLTGRNHTVNNTEIELVV